jgi:outer membrane murein-binding lipoprotein Lpp
MRRVWLALVILGVLLLAGCVDCKLGSSLASSGSAAANNLAAFYAGLIQDTIDTLELEAFTSAIRGVSFDTAEQKLLTDHIAELRARQVMAKRLAGFYKAVSDLCSYNASGEVKTAASDLSKSLSVPSLGSGINPGAIIGSAAGELAALAQSRDLVKGLKASEPALEKLIDLVTQERKITDAISQERSRKIVDVAAFLVDNDLLATKA